MFDRYHAYLHLPFREIRMQSARDWLDPGGRITARRLDQLHSTLDALGDRLRQAVAEAVAESLGGWIRDAFLTTLEQISGHVSDPNREASLIPQRRWQGPGRWEEPSRRIERDDADEREIWPASYEREYSRDSYDEREPDETDRFEEPTQAPSQATSDRLALSLAAGLQAAAWWLRRAAQRRPLLSLTGIGLLVGLAALMAPVLTTAAFRLATTAGQLDALTDAAGFHRSFPSRFRSA
jgi:hypothetical protein